MIYRLRYKLPRLASQDTPSKFEGDLFLPPTSYLLPLTSYLFLLFAFCISCNNTPSTGVIQNTTTKNITIDPLVEDNKKIVELENEEIELFLKRYQWTMKQTDRYQWTMKQTDTGLRYEITKNGKGKNFNTGDEIVLEYKTFLLSGDEIYNSKEDGLKRFVVEKSEEIAGLHEAAKLMNRGTEARLIIPSHLAYGVPGDGNKIKPYQTIIMKILTN